MEWLSLVVWTIIAALALPLAAGAIFGRMSLGVQALAGIGGLALLIVICIEGLLTGVAWTAVGLGFLGALASMIAGFSLSSEHGGLIRGVEAVEEQQAMMVGAQMMLFMVAAMLTLLVALNVGRA